MPASPEFKKRIEETLGNRMPKNPKLSALSGRIILSMKDYNDLQLLYTHEAYNMWCTGVNKHTDPNKNPELPFFNYIEVGDAKNFSDLFITEHEAELEAKQATNE